MPVKDTYEVAICNKDSIYERRTFDLPPLEPKEARSEIRKLVELETKGKFQVASVGFKNGTVFKD
jgi:hypothetical protein